MKYRILYSRVAGKAYIQARRWFRWETMKAEDGGWLFCDTVEQGRALLRAFRYRDDIKTKAPGDGWEVVDDDQG